MFVEPWDGRGQSSFAGRGRLPVRDVVRVMHAWTVQLGSARSGPDGNVAGQGPFSVPGSPGPYESVRRWVAPAVAPVANSTDPMALGPLVPPCRPTRRGGCAPSSGVRRGRWTATVVSPNASLPRSKGCSATDGTKELVRRRRRDYPTLDAAATDSGTVILAERGRVLPFHHARCRPFPISGLRGGRWLRIGTRLLKSLPFRLDGK